jgi:alkanesulfonate monooxygenase SsuD/methylene tetrahydromethanopterin reductase-like flavin-dependent oxidoreductase (luciferase family)
MHVGVMLPSMGHLAEPNNLIAAAQEAERLGCHSLWTADRLLYPVNPRSKYPVTPDGSLPDIYSRVLDPVEALTFVAAHTERIDSAPTSSIFLFIIQSPSFAG